MQVYTFDEHLVTIIAYGTCFGSCGDCPIYWWFRMLCRMRMVVDGETYNCDSAAARIGNIGVYRANI